VFKWKLMLDLVFHPAVNNYGLLKDKVGNHEEVREPKQYSPYYISKIQSTRCNVYSIYLFL